ncbi:hypothetical protein [Niveispirillum fermenti]|uniref:hypothetical protein n=1 Tax=Niveispirillum fermenti TaxID=1233113 RepID=UPI003A886E47
MSSYSFEITMKFKNRGDMEKAEDWINDNIKGLWALEFLGMQEEMSVDTGLRSQVLNVLFKFGRREDFERFRNEYVMGKRPAAAATKKPKVPEKPKGFFARLFS